MFVVITQCFPSRLGGIENLMGNIALNLSKKNKVIVLADRYQYLNDLVYDNQNKKKFLVKRYGGLKFLRKRKKVRDLKILLESNDIKLIIADTWKSLELSIDYINEKKIRSICLAHGNEFLDKKKKKIKRIVNTLNKVSLIKANSNFTSSLVKRIINNKKKVEVVYPGANNLNNLESDNFFKINGYPVILTLGRLEKRKGHSKVLESIYKLRDSYPDIQYIIAGDGEEIENLKKIVNKLNLKKNVNFVGSVNDNKKKYIFENTTLMVMPTLDESENKSIEGFGIAYIEAAFFGIPSIASDVGGTPEAVIDKKTGIIIKKNADLYLSIKDLLSDKEKFEILRINAKKRAIENFDWKKTIDKYLN